MQNREGGVGVGGGGVLEKRHPRQGEEKDVGNSVFSQRTLLEKIIIFFFHTGQVSPSSQSHTACTGRSSTAKPCIATLTWMRILHIL